MSKEIIKIEQGEEHINPCSGCMYENDSEVCLHGECIEGMVLYIFVDTENMKAEDFLT